MGRIGQKDGSTRDRRSMAHRPKYRILGKYMAFSCLGGGEKDTASREPCGSRHSFVRMRIASDSISMHTGISWSLWRSWCCFSIQAFVEFIAFTALSQHKQIQALLFHFILEPDPVTM